MLPYQTLQNHMFLAKLESCQYNFRQSLGQGRSVVPVPELIATVVDHVPNITALFCLFLEPFLSSILVPHLFHGCPYADWFPRVELG